MFALRELELFAVDVNRNFGQGAFLFELFYKASVVFQEVRAAFVPSIRTQSPDYLQYLICKSVAIIGAVGGFAVIFYNGRRAKIVYGVLAYGLTCVFSIAPAETSVNEVE